MKKRVLVLTMVGIMALAAVACGDEDTAATQETQVEETVEASSDVASDETKAEVPQEDLEENSIDFIKQISDESAPTIDTKGCTTFTDMLNKKRVTKGMGYANVDLGETNCCFITSGTYDNLDGNYAGIDAAIFVYDDEVGEPVEIGKVCSGGTAYPIATDGQYVYTASNHWVCKYVCADNKLSIMEKASVIYDTDGVGTYFYESEDGGDYTKMDSAEAEKIFNNLFEEMGHATIVNFNTVMD